MARIRKNTKKVKPHKGNFLEMPKDKLKKPRAVGKYTEQERKALAKERNKPASKPHEALGRPKVTENRKNLSDLKRYATSTRVKEYSEFELLIRAINAK